MKIIFAGTPLFALPALETLIQSPHEVCAVYTQPDRPAGRGQKLTPSPIKQCAIAHHIPILQPLTLKNAEIQDTLRSHQADLMIVAAYGLILPKVVLSIPRLGCVNLHASLLPRWRGAAPIQRAILAGDNITGITVMQMAAGLDTGDMLYKITCTIDATDTTKTLHDKLAALAAEALITTLPAIKEQTLTPEKQDETLTCYAAKIEKSEAKIVWAHSASTIDRAIRAFNPWPIAHTHLDDTVLRVWQAVPLHLSTDAPPGTILANSSEGIDVATGEGVLRLQILQLPGAKPLPAHALLNAKKHLFSAGKRLV